ncbi:MAG: zf-HC2 domain-containing protein [Chloroflexota bacterium]|nr:zf-HC2 domain-containing protein [Chloroflexota bacterium]
MNQHVDELISASLSGDLSDLEKAQLEAHLRECPQCRETMAAFSDQRRLVSGLRHTAPPADLGARVRTGLERGSFIERPWWRRPGGILTLGAGLATIAAAAALALVVLNLPARTPVGATATPSPSVAATPSGSATTTSPSPQPTSASTPLPAGLLRPGEIGFLSLTGPLGSQELSVRGYDTATKSAPKLVALTTPGGPPIAATLSPTGEWLAYQTRKGLKGTNEIWAVRLSDAQTRDLGETSGDDPFTKRMTWSLDGRFLAYTGLFGGSQPTLDVGLFDTQVGTSHQLTFLKAAYAGSFDGERLWISVVGDPPNSYLVPLDGDLSNPAAAAIRTLDATFLPILSPDGTRSIYWRGRMTQQGFGWIFRTGGMPYLAGGSANDPFAGEKQLFPTLVAGQNAFTSAEIAWSTDSDWFTVWNTSWTGNPQSGPSGERFPDPTYVYFGQASGNLIDATQANLGIRATDGSRSIIDVVLWPNGDGNPTPGRAVVTLGIGGGGESPGSPGEMAHLWVTVAAPSGDTNTTLGDPKGWNGPAVIGPGG